MTRTLTIEIPELIERAAAAAETDVGTFLLRAGMEKAAQSSPTRPEAPAFLTAVESLRGDLRGAGFGGVNGADLVKAGRDERATQIYGD